MCSATSSPTAWRSVPTETPKAAASGVSLGSVAPGASVPSSMARSSARLTARYKGMPGAGLIGAKLRVSIAAIVARVNAKIQVICMT